MIKRPIYLDYAATTPVDPLVAEKMQRYLTMDGVFGNSASITHSYGAKAKEAVEKARSQIADLINCEPREIIWTSGATESNNLAIKGAARFYRDKKSHIITSKIEHKSVIDTCCYLEGEGFRVTYLEPEQNGLIDIDRLKDAICDETLLVSIHHINNEIGVVQDICKIGNVCHEKGVLLHVDAAQSAGKISIDIQELPVDLMSFSAHKCYGPKGVGALYVRHKPRVRLGPMIHGGGQEQGLRSGTLATHQLVGMGEAFSIAKERLNEESLRILQLRKKLLDGILGSEYIHVNGDLKQCVSGIINFSVEGVEGTSLIMALSDLAISMGAACTSVFIEPSYVLRALGLSDELASSSIRISIGRFTSEEEIDFAISHINEKIKWLRGICVF